MKIDRNYLPNYTYEDYKQWKGEWELIEGIPYAMAPSPFGKHQRIIMEFGRQIANQLENCKQNCFVYPELDWIVNENTVLRPDLLVTCKYIEEYLRETPEVVIEVVSKSTVIKDEKVKFEIYEKEGVKYYILVYPEIKKIRGFNLKRKKYEKFFDSDIGKFSIKLKNGCEFEIDAEKLLTL